MSGSLNDDLGEDGVHPHSDDDEQTLGRSGSWLPGWPGRRTAPWSWRLSRGRWSR